jgi:hypothetical protein
LLTQHLGSVARWLNYFKDLYDENFKSPCSPGPDSLAVTDPLHLQVVKGTTELVSPPFTESQQVELRTHGVKVVKSTFRNILKNDEPNAVYIILNFANTSLVVKGGQDIEMAEEFPGLQREYDAIMVSRLKEMDTDETAIVHIP